jgi:hypothetical protein
MFLYFRVLTFTWLTSRHNALARVSKSRVADFRSDLSRRNKGYRIGSSCTTNERSRGRGLPRIPLSAIADSPLSRKLWEQSQEIELLET